MRKLSASEIPLLPVKDFFNGESIAFGVFGAGVVIQFMERDECLLIEWGDIITLGIGMLEATVKNPPAEEIESRTEHI